jgi:5-(carboxyamino)imidazole ribonucleotide synthase
VKAVLPGSTIGLLGGGQLARMTALAARSMGYHIAVLDPDPHCAASPLADEVIAASFDDAGAAAQLATSSNIVTYEIERIAPAALEAAAASAPLRPSPSVLEIVQDRARQKRWLSSHGFPVGDWRLVANAAELAAAVSELGPCRAKRTYGGYDGRSQTRVTSVDQAANVFDLLRGECVAEKELSLALELSVLVACSHRGVMTTHPIAENWHEDGILIRSLIPAQIDEKLAAQATQVACEIAAALDVRGLLAVELFVTQNGELLVNELAPRPHNTFHAAGEACATGQFSQFVRAVCGMPLGSTEPHSSAVLMNLLGDLWQEGPPDFESALRVPGVSLHLYGKEPRPRRKVGHLVAQARTAAQALVNAETAFSRLSADRVVHAAVSAHPERE